jgi:hypothetical protein
VIGRVTRDEPRNAAVKDAEEEEASMSEDSGRDEEREEAHDESDGDYLAASLFLPSAVRTSFWMESMKKRTVRM